MVDKLPISVVIPHRNQSQYVQGAVYSALNAEAIDCLVFDDYSDKSFDYLWGKVRSYASFAYRVGAGTARNFLIDETLTDLIVCLDSDDRLLPDGLERLYAAYKPGTWVYSGWQEIDENEAVLGDYEAPPTGNA